MTSSLFRFLHPSGSERVKAYYMKHIFPRVLKEVYENIPEQVPERLKKLGSEAEHKNTLEVLRKKGATSYLEQLASEAAEIFAPELKKSLKDNIYVGEFPLMKLNARITYVPEARGYLILVFTGLKVFVAQLMSAMVSCVGSADFSRNGQLQQVVWTPEIGRKEAIRYMLSLLENLRRGQIAYSPIVLDPRSNSLRLKILHGLELYVIAHEYAHYILGHLDKASMSALPIAGSDFEIRVFNKSQEKELQADTFATLQAAEKIMDGRIMYPENIIRFVYGPLFLFSVAELIDTVFPENEDASHPNGRTRYKNVRSSFERIMGATVFQVFDFFREMIEETLQKL